jgi:hypothetical protein
VKAQYNLGMVYLKGEGVTRDYTEATRWYRKAGEQGHSDAQSNLGAMYFEGRGVEQDCDEAVKWLRLAAEQGHSKAQFNLGFAHTQEAMGRNYAEAAKWYVEAAGRGHSGAQYNLGLMYEGGLGVEASESQAMQQYALAAAQGFPGAQQRLDQLARVSREDIVTFFLFRGGRSSVVNDASPCHENPAERTARRSQELAQEFLRQLSSMSRYSSNFRSGETARGPLRASTQGSDLDNAAANAFTSVTAAFRLARRRRAQPGASAVGCGVSLELCANQFTGRMRGDTAPASNPAAKPPRPRASKLPPLRSSSSSSSLDLQMFMSSRFFTEDPAWSHAP